MDTERHAHDAECAACWGGFPKQHGQCPGLMHAEFGDEDSDCNYWLYYWCDSCGSTCYEEEN